MISSTGGNKNIFDYIFIYYFSYSLVFMFHVVFSEDLNKMKNIKYHTVGTVPKSNQQM